MIAEGHVRGPSGYPEAMSTTPFEPSRQSGEGSSDRIPAADPGRGAPEPAPGFGVTGEQPDQPEETRDPRGRGIRARVRRWIRALTRR